MESSSGVTITKITNSNNNNITPKRERNIGVEKEWCTWDEWEIVTLISIYGSADIQAQLTLSKHNSRVFELIAERMKSYDIERTPQQCRNKIKKLKCEYRKVTTDPAYGKTFNYYDQMSPFMKDTQNYVELDFDPKSMLDIISSYGPPPALTHPPLPPSLKKLCKEEPPASDDSRNYVEVELEEGSDSCGEDYREQHWPPSKPELLLQGGGGGTKRSLQEMEEEYEDDEDEDPNGGGGGGGETSLESCSDSEQIGGGQASNGSVKRLRINVGGGHHQEQQQQRQQQEPVLETLMETFLESMRRERRSMRKEMAKFEEKRIQLENEAELKKLQMEHQHELKMATLLGQITTQIIDSLAKRE